MPLNCGRTQILRALKRVILLVLLISLFSSHLTARADSPVRTIVYGRGCLSCFLEYADELNASLVEAGMAEVELRYLESDPAAAGELDQLHDGLRVPYDMRSVIAVSFDNKFLFEGRVPARIIADFLANHTQEYSSIVIYRDEMRNSYKVMDGQGRVTECRLENSISECSEQLEPMSSGSVLLLVLMSGLLDGINPCAFTVLILFVALLFTVGSTTPQRQTRRRVLLIGTVYVSAIFLAYLAIGLSLLGMIGLTPFPHLVAKTSAALIIILGLNNIRDYLWPERGLGLEILRTQWVSVRGWTQWQWMRWMRNLTLPAAFVLGTLVGFFEFPCTGSVYVAILGLLAARTTFLEGLGYLILYNVAFILPLIVVLVLASDRRVGERSLARWQRKGRKEVKLLSGLIMLALGALLLILGSA